MRSLRCIVALLAVTFRKLEFLMAQFDGEPSATESKRFAEHLVECPACANFLATKRLPAFVAVVLSAAALASAATHVVGTCAAIDEAEERSALRVPLTPHLQTLAGHLGVSEMHHVRIEYQKFGGERHRRSVAEAHTEVVRLAEQLAAQGESKAA